MMIELDKWDRLVSIMPRLSTLSRFDKMASSLSESTSTEARGAGYVVFGLYLDGDGWPRRKPPGRLDLEAMNFFRTLFGTFLRIPFESVDTLA